MYALQQAKDCLVGQGLCYLVDELPKLHKVGVSPLEVSGRTHDT